MPDPRHPQAMQPAGDDQPVEPVQLAEPIAPEPGVAAVVGPLDSIILDRPAKPEFDHASSILYFAVPDINTAHGGLKEKGVRFEDEPHMIARMTDHDLWMTFFRDSEDNLLALMSEVKR